jgi:hypothetical protein
VDANKHKKDLYFYKPFYFVYFEDFVEDFVEDLVPVFVVVFPFPQRLSAHLGVLLPNRSFTQFGRCDMVIPSFLQ